MNNLNSSKKVKHTPERMRRKIRDSQLLNKLINHVNGIEELSSSQCMVALKLVGKILPDLKQVEVQQHVNYQSLTIDQLNGRLATLGIDADQAWKRLNRNIVDVKEPVLIDQDKPDDDVMIE